MFYGVVSESLPLSLPDVAGTDDVGAYHVDVAAVISAHLARRYHPDTGNVNAIAGVIAYATIKSDPPRRDGNILTTISLRPFALRFSPSLIATRFCCVNVPEVGVEN